MCLACEQDAIWLAYLDSQGLLKPDDPAAVDELFSAFPVQPLPVKREWDAPTPKRRRMLWQNRPRPGLPRQNRHQRIRSLATILLLNDRSHFAYAGAGARCAA